MSEDLKSLRHLAVQLLFLSLCVSVQLSDSVEVTSPQSATSPETSSVGSGSVSQEGDSVMVSQTGLTRATQKPVIDSSVIHLMTDDQLRESSCRRKESEPSSRKSKQLRGKNAQGKKRIIELRWMHCREGECVQVCTKHRGGTRTESVPEDSIKQNLIEKAVQLFFPGGKNANGSLADFDIDLMDFQQHSLEDNVTVEELYEKTKLPFLRFYLTTKKRAIASDTNLEGENSEATAQEGEKTHDIYRHSLDNSAAGTVEINTSDAIYVESSTEFAHSQSVSLPSTRVDGTDASHQNNQRQRLNNIIVLHRGQILRELIRVFSEESIMEDDIYFDVILPDGKLVKAVDDGCVFRNVVSEFWNDFYGQCTIGNVYRVPYPCHGFGKEEWESVGRIITFGWQKEKYLPVRLAPVLLEQAVLGSVESDLVDSFLKYVSDSERMIFESCRSDFEGVDQSALLEIMNIHRLPTADTIEQILRELAHQKLIQEPAFVIEQWSNMLTPLKSELKGIAAIYEELQPTSLKILRSITYTCIKNLEEKQIVWYVGHYLRESDTQHLSFFLRFCNGADLFTGKTITVSFTQVQGFQRRPDGHTCACYLEFPVRYDNYTSFRHEMNKVLESNVWVMDIV